MIESRVPQIFSARRRRVRWLRALAEQRRGGAADFVFRSMAEELEERLDFMQVRPNSVLLSGDPTGLAQAALATRANSVLAVAPSDHDEEAAFDGSFDLIASLGTLDTVNDVPGALIHLRAALAPGGIAMVSFVGAGSLANLRRALLAAEPDRPAARMHPMIDVQAGSALMQRAGFARQVADGYTLRVRYGALDRLVEDLRDQALTNVLAAPPPPLSRTALQRARDAFADAADEDGRVTELFEIVTLTGWKD
ncbi:methyltransferase domain-containing protein [Pelagerythrobacter rhizovicinus]|uniref:Methyltransferase domain-containing protein n=1 Tax=Pelagerythrobacter rhizovicinus TaxID=2268576 RepID=A0A4Q2KLI4_9SPHN|nr:methyltransferase domain-containing protein [Pelagerythrobacter rhizovicinus]RXZ66168.1 methyltransferase domain-containing protein [Pelagerythrobacter rhizovicinus]